MVTFLQPVGPAPNIRQKLDLFTLGSNFRIDAAPSPSKVELDKFTPNAFTDDFRAPPAMEAFHKYGQKIGVYVCSFSTPGLYFENHPEWASIDENGKVSEYLFGSKVCCPASGAYMDHTLKILDHVFTKYKPRWWGFDGRWLSYWEVPK